MNTIKSILTRRTIRDWTNKYIKNEIILKILDAGRHAPSPLNSQPWHFIVVKKKNMVLELMKYANHGNFLSHAKVIIVVTVEKKARVDYWLSEHEQHLFSGACALQNMWLAAHDLGLGSCWVTLDESKTEKLLAIPSNQKVVGCLATGYAKEDFHKDCIRDQLSEFVSYERFNKNKKRVYNFTGKIKKVIQETHDVRTFILRKPNGFLYKAGQYCILNFTDKRKINGKNDVPMTISSSPTEKDVSFTIKNMGGFTKELHKLKVGGPLEVTGPIGTTFIFDESTRGDFVFLSGGTGIAPFISILRLIIAKGMKNNVIMLNANKSFNSIIFREELDHINDTYKNVQIINTLDSFEESWVGERGFIDKKMIQRYIKKPKKVTWFLCGPPRMIHSLKSALLELGVSEYQIKMDDWEIPGKSHNN